MKDGSSSQLPSCYHTVTIMIPRCFMMFLCGRARSGHRKVLEALERYEKVGDHRISDLLQICWENCAQFTSNSGNLRIDHWYSLTHHCEFIGENLFGSIQIYSNLFFASTAGALHRFTSLALLHVEAPWPCAPCVFWTSKAQRIELSLGSSEVWTPEHLGLANGLARFRKKVGMLDPSCWFRFTLYMQAISVLASWV